MKFRKYIGYLMVFSAISWMAFATTSKMVNSQTIFKEVKIGTQNWMSENLNVATFSNGDSILEVRSSDEWKKAAFEKLPAYCYYKFDTSNSAKFGRLYNWYAVNDRRGLAPKGWRIPSDKDWNILIQFLGGHEASTNKLKSTSGWSDTRNGNNSSGFNALPVNGYHGMAWYMEGVWHSATSFWCSNSSIKHGSMQLDSSTSKYIINEYYGNVCYLNIDCNIGSENKFSMMPIRCIKK